MSDFGVGHSIEYHDNLKNVTKPQSLKPPEANLIINYSGKAADLYLCGATLFHMIFGTLYKPSEKYFLLVKFEIFFCFILFGFSI